MCNDHKHPQSGPRLISSPIPTAKSLSSPLAHALECIYCSVSLFSSCVLCMYVCMYVFGCTYALEVCLDFLQVAFLRRGGVERRRVLPREREELERHIHSRLWCCFCCKSPDLHTCTHIQSRFLSLHVSTPETHIYISPSLDRSLSLFFALCQPRNLLFSLVPVDSVSCFHTSIFSFIPYFSMLPYFLQSSSCSEYSSQHASSSSSSLMLVSARQP